MNDKINIALETQDIDLILDLITRKIEKCNSDKEITEDMFVYRKNLESLKNEIVAQISN